MVKSVSVFKDVHYILGLNKEFHIGLIISKFHASEVEFAKLIDSVLSLISMLNRLVFVKDSHSLD